jgi:hypothetical protein
MSTKLGERGETYGGIGALAELLELLEGTRVTLVHGGYALAAA